MSREDEINRLLQIHKRRLQKLEEQRALFGDLHSPVHLLTQIEDEIKEIDKLETELKDLPPKSLPENLNPLFSNPPIHKKSNFKSRVVGTGFIAVPGFILFHAIFRLVESLFASSFAFTSSFFIYMSLGTCCVLLNVYWINKVYQDGKRRQHEALNELQQRILDRIDEPELLTPRSVRGLAYGIEKKVRCSIITDKLICEAIRAAALELEDNYSGDQLIHRLKLLNQLLLGIDANEPPLLSLAVVDRLYAYKNSQLFVMLIVFIGILLVFIYQYPPYLASVLLVIQFFLVFSTIRARFFWKYSSISNKSAEPRFIRWLFNVHPNPVLDFFLSASISRKRWTNILWNHTWMSIWEQPIIQKFASSPAKFAAMHEFRYDHAKNLYSQLTKVQRKIDISRLNGLSPKDTDKQQIQSLSRQLWVVTGDNRFREVEYRGELATDDVTNSVMRFL